jgi:hypothetical protein
VTLMTLVTVCGPYMVPGKTYTFSTTRIGGREGSQPSPSSHSRLQSSRVRAPEHLDDRVAHGALGRCDRGPTAPLLSDSPSAARPISSTPQTIPVRWTGEELSCGSYVRRRRSRRTNQLRQPELPPWNSCGSSSWAWPDLRGLAAAAKLRLRTRSRSFAPVTTTSSQPFRDSCTATPSVPPPVRSPCATRQPRRTVPTQSHSKLFAPNTDYLRQNRPHPP